MGRSDIEVKFLYFTGTNKCKYEVNSNKFGYIL